MLLRSVAPSPQGSFPLPNMHSVGLTGLSFGFGYAVFHEACATEWWGKAPGNFCLVHRRAVAPDTMVVG